ncbi:unnamed protein product [Polarella glacialis]|uniref:Rubredoxin-like domain-containing protein n=1 Tax=Polarella glacialis TaxID=89957 RepID=A0A813DF22_POLGL|nr:unnamed protein product [Polarella glacialis]
MSARTPLRRLRLVTAALSLCILVLSLPSRGPAWVAASSGSGLRGFRQQLAAKKKEDSGEFDFGEYTTSIMQPSALDADEEDKPEMAPPEAEVFLQRETGRYECGSCQYAYDPLWGVGDVSPGTKFKDLPTNWRCPKCRVSKDEFAPITEEIAGFAENQEFGLGFNTMTQGQKGFVIWGGLFVLFLGLMSGYAIE